MSPFISLLRGALATAVFVGVLTLGTIAQSGADEELGVLAGTVVVPDGMLPHEVQDAAVMTLAGREWGIRHKDEERVVGYLKHRSNEATVTLIYRDSKVEVYCVGWAIDKRTGARKKPEQPKGWLKNIMADLTKNLNQMSTTR